MARCRRRVSNHTRSWFLLKDSVIFVIVMCMLPPFYNSTQFYALEELKFQTNEKETKEKLQHQQQQQQKQQELLKPTKFNDNEIIYKDAKLNNWKDLIRVTTEELPHVQNNNSNNNIEINLRNNHTITSTRTTAATTSLTLNHKSINKVKNNVDNVVNIDNILSNESFLIARPMAITTITIATTTVSTASTASTANSNIVNKRHSLSNNHVAAVDAKATLAVAVAVAVATATANATVTATDYDNNFGLRENVVLPSKDPEREAQLLYEKSLQEFHNTFLNNQQQQQQDHEITDNNNKHHHLNNVERSLHAVCELWSAKHCHCTGTLGRLSLSCRNIGVLAVPVDLPPDTVVLDLGNNNITKLEANSFFMVINLEELTLADNSLSVMDPLAFYGLSKLKRLNLQNCGLKSLTAFAFQGLTNLISLQLNGNALASMDSDSLRNLPKLRSLRLEGNLFYKIPTNVLSGLKTLEALNIGSNLLTLINDDDFPHMPNLIVLLLKRNQIMKISDGAFKNLTALKVLELDDNLINIVPEGLSKLHHLQEFSITSNRLRFINSSDLPKSLHILDMRANPISRIMPTALEGMRRLRKLILSDVRFLKDFPYLEGCLSLEILKLDRAGIAEVPPHLCRHLPRLKSLELKTNSIQRIPLLVNCRDLRLLDLSNNYIEHLNGRPFHGLKQLHDLLLSYNRIQMIPQDAFHGINKLQLLDLEGNQINYIHKDAFLAISNLEDLNLGNNIFPELPSRGVQRLLHLKTFNNPKLREFPPPETFPRIQTLILSYAYHCCPFIPLVASSSKKKVPLVQEAVLFPSDTDFDMTLWNNSMLDIWPQLHNLSKKFGSQMYDIWDNFAQNTGTYSKNMPNYIEEYFEGDTPAVASISPNTYAASFADGNYFATQLPEHSARSVQCLPMPGPFLPCADLFDWWTLRCGVWIVFLLALLGNGTVVFVLLLSRSKMDVPRFLVCNLAAADFFMGIYLGILAIVDASTLGEFRMFAIPWQMSVLCQIAGFLAVLSSELSVYTLAVITLERNYAITHAIHLNKRLSLKQAGYIMAVGWSFALIMATLPVAGISDYRKFAVCLPFETTTSLGSLTYVIGLMFINGCAFLTLMGCYLKMYWAIRGSQAWNTNDSRIAKRMALLVFTDFLCWSPIAFFSITAIFGFQLISLEQAKIFTVFILPLNSCCNPFLYAIMTKQFKKDCVNLCKHFEETRVTRGAGAGLTRRALAAQQMQKELPPLLPVHHPPGCKCLRMLPGEMPHWHRMEEKQTSVWVRSWQNVKNCCSCYIRCCYCFQPSTKRRKKEGRKSRGARGQKADPYEYHIAEIKQRKQTRANSISSENFCSSRSSSWRNGASSSSHQLHHGHGHTCNVPLKVLEAKRRKHSTWLITRKTSQDSNLSSSRNDSSASATTASTSTFRLSRSSGGSSTPLPSIINHTIKSQAHHQYNTSLSKPKLVRQEAVQEEDDSTSPPRLGVRFLPTIPSAADSSIIIDDGDSAIAGGTGGIVGGGAVALFENMQINMTSSSRKCTPTLIMCPPIPHKEPADNQPP